MLQEAVVVARRIQLSIAGIQVGADVADRLRVRRVVILATVPQRSVDTRHSKPYENRVVDTLAAQRAC